jgi:iron complex transport system substrate-binding protein
VRHGARARLGLGALAAVLSTGGCGRERAPRDATVVDATGATVAVPREIRRVAATLPGLAQIVAALGRLDLLVAVPSAGRLPPEFARIPRIATYPTIPAESLAAVRPDLVLVDPTLSPRDVLPLRERFPVFAADSRSLDGLRATFVALGRALGREAEGERLAQDLDRAREEVAGAARGVRVLAASGGDSLHALGPGSLLHDVLVATGAENVAAGLGRSSAAVSDERLRAWAPDWILVAGGPVPRDLSRRFPRVPAVANGRVVEASDDDLARAGPGTAGAMRRLARVLSGEAPPQTLRGTR